MRCYAVSSACHPRTVIGRRVGLACECFCHTVLLSSHVKHDNRDVIFVNLTAVCAKRQPQPIAFRTPWQGPSGLHQYRLRTMFDEVPLPWDWPVLVNYHESKAFATWKTSTEEQVRPTSSSLGICVTKAIVSIELGLFAFAENGTSQGFEHFLGRIVQIFIADSTGQRS